MLKDFVYRYSGDPTILPEMRRWLMTCIGTDNYREFFEFGYIVFRFEREDDMVSFKLAWGDSSNGFWTDAN